MFERFTDRARKVLALANQEAMRFHHEYIGTEHILLGLVEEGSGVGTNVLKNLNVDLRRLREETEKLIKSGPDMVTVGKLPQTPRAKKVIEYAIEESRRFGHNYVGTEHLLLGLFREQDGVAAVVLRIMELQLEQVRNEVLDLLGVEDDNVVYSTPEAQRAGDRAGNRAREMGHPTIGTGHLLLGLLEEEAGMAARLLAKLGVKAEMVRKEIVKYGGRESEA